MPELPEVETLRRGLTRVLPDRPITSVQILDAKVVAGSREVAGDRVTGRRITQVARRGKVLIFPLADSGSLLVHPKMTGQLIVTVAGATVIAGGHPTPSMLRPMPNPTTRAIFGLGHATRLLLQRRPTIRLDPPGWSRAMHHRPIPEPTRA